MTRTLRRTPFLATSPILGTPVHCSEDFVKNEEENTDRDPTIGNVEDRERSDFDIVSDETIAQTIEKVGESAAEHHAARESHAYGAVSPPERLNDDQSCDNEEGLEEWRQS